MPRSAPSRCASSSTCVGDDNVATPKYVTLGPARRTACASSSRACSRRRRHRQRPDARAPGREGGAAAGAPPTTGVKDAYAQASARTERQRDAHLALLHRPADLCRRDLDRVRDPRRRLDRPPADCAVSRDRAARHQRHRPISRRQRRGRGQDRRLAARAADQRRRAHALHLVELDGRRPLLDLGDVRSRHQPRHRAGAGAEPRRDRPAAPAGRRAQHRRHRRQGLARPDDGRAHVLARQVARHAVHLELRQHQRRRRA